MVKLSNIHAQANPRIHVDDTALQATGESHDDVLSKLVPAVVCFAQGAKQLKLSLSPKAVIAASNLKLANFLHKELKDYGISFKVSLKHARDLGVTHNAATASADKQRES